MCQAEEAMNEHQDDHYEYLNTTYDCAHVFFGRLNICSRPIGLLEQAPKERKLVVLFRAQGLEKFTELLGPRPRWLSLKPLQYQLDSICSFGLSEACHCRKLASAFITRFLGYTIAGVYCSIAICSNYKETLVQQIRAKQ